MAEAFGVEVTRQRIEIYEQSLGDIPLPQLEAAFQSALKTCQRFPSIAEIRAQAAKQTAAEDQFEADKAWNDVKQMLRRHWFGELMPVMVFTKPENWQGRIQEHNGGFLLFPPPLDAATDYAIRLAGGFERIVSSDGTSEQDFIHRDFLANFKRHRETQGLLAPSREDAQKFLEKLQQKKIAGAEG